MDISHRAPTLPQSLVAAVRKKSPRQIELRSEAPCTTIASYNIHKCVGTDGMFAPERIGEVIGELDADLVALQEADERTGSRKGLLDLAAIKRKTGLVPAHAHENQRSHGWHGNLILMREGTIQAVETIALPGLEPRGAVIVDLEMKGVELRIVAAHFGLLRRSRSQQASTLLQATQSILRPTLLLGDLNEWRVHTRSSLLGLMPHFGPIHPALPSFPSRFPLLALDRILARPQHIIASIEVHQSPLATVASDHLPIKARLNLEAARRLPLQPDAA